MYAKSAVVCFVSLSCFLATNASAFQEHPLDKMASETWHQYVSRLFDVGEITEDQFDQWERGGDLTITKLNAVTRTRTETRTRTTPVTRIHTVTNDEGEEVQEVITENVSQNYLVNVPYVEQLTHAITIPAKGSKSETSLFSEFGNIAPQLPSSLPNPVPSLEPPTQENIQAKSKKQKSENWDAYIGRLVEQGLLNTDQLNRWKLGKDVQIEMQKSFPRFRQETRTRAVPVTRTRTETKDDGTEVLIPYTETVNQTYTVTVPYSETRQISLTLPGRGKRAADATTEGFKYKNKMPARVTKSKRKQQHNSELAKIMKVKPKQRDAKFTRVSSLDDLKIDKVKENGVSGWEVHDSQGRVLRRFFDIDGDDKADNWVYFKNGKESYREIDLDGDGKVDQYQYTNGKSIRFGIDKDQDGKIDRWEK